MTVLKRYLTEEEQARLLKVVRGAAGMLAQRDYAWMRLLIETGMRVNELATMTYRQATTALATGWLSVAKEQRKGKRKGHQYLVTEPVRQCLEALMEVQDELRPMVDFAPLMERPEGFVPPLIWGRCGVVRGRVMCEHMSVRSFQARMKHWAYLAGLPAGVSPHWLRHTRGVNIVRRSRGRNPMKVAQEALGHVSIASTGIYTQLARQEYELELHRVAGGRMRKADARALAELGAV